MREIKWENRALSELGSVSRGKSKHRPRNDKKLYEGDYPFIQTADVKNANFYISEFSQTYNEVGLKQSKLWETDTLCITIAANIAETALLSFPACFPDSIVGFIPFDNVSDVRYIKYTLDNYKTEFQKRSKGATQDNLSVSKINSLKLLIPQYDYQVEVADIISRYDLLIEINQKRISLLKEMSQRLYKEWFVEFKFPEYRNVKMIEMESGIIPEGWKVMKISDIGKVITGRTPSKKINDYYGSEIMFVKTPDFEGRIFIHDTKEMLTKIGLNTQKDKLLPPHTVMISTIGTIGKVAITTAYCTTNQQINSLLMNDPDNYVFFYLLALDLKPKLEGLGSNGATMGNVSKSKFENIQIMIPNAVLFERFSKLTIPVFTEIEKLEKLNINLCMAKTILIENLLTGKRYIKDFSYVKQ